MRTFSISLGFAVVLTASCWCQQAGTDWRAEVRSYVEASNWSAALALVDKQLAQAPNDSEVLAWRARVLLWAGRLDEAESQWKQVLAVAPNDPDNWMGIAGVYSRRGSPRQALEALDKAAQLDSKRADAHIARARALLALHEPNQAELEFRRAAQLDPSSTDAKSGLLSLRAAPKHQLLFGTETDLFSFSGPYQQNDVTLLSQWSEHWKTGVGGGFYERGGFQAKKFQASVSGISSSWGALTVGGTAADDYGIIPRNEAFFEYDRGWKLPDGPVIRGVEFVYGQHWYWYSTARVLALAGATIVYLPRDWTWSFALTGARSQFGSGLSQWSPSGSSKLGFPVVPSERHRLDGNIFVASGTENFSQIDQIGSFASHTYGGGFRFQLTKQQDVTSFAAYQLRSKDQRQTTFGVTYGVRF